MKVAIIGAGFGGLAVGYRLAKNGVAVTIVESEEIPGGLAVGFTRPKWEWSLEKHYHHWFTNDYSVLNLSQVIGHKVITVRPKTSTFVDGEVYQLDSPLSLLLFEKLPLFDRLKTGAVLAYLKTTSNWKSLESIKAAEFLRKYNGETAWKILWKPLFQKKFDNFASEIPASWFWARIKKRTPSLAYPEGGFLSFAKHLAQSIREHEGKVYYKTKVERILRDGKSLIVRTTRGNARFDKVIVTSPSFVFTRIAPDLPNDYKSDLLNLKGIGAVNLLLSLNKQFLEDGTYWLNVNNVRFPFLAVVEHTNFMDKAHYNNEHLVYVGNYLPHEHPYFKKEAIDLLREFFPFLKTINPKFNHDWLNDIYLFKAPFAQPIIPLNYSKMLPPFETPVEGLYLCNIQQVYPWDRGTNYAVENGEKVAEIVLESQ